MGVILLEPIRIVESLSGSQVWRFEEDGAPKDFTGWTGDWRIAHRDDGDLVTGTLSLSSQGRIEMTWTAAQSDVLADYAPKRGAVLSNVALEFEATNGSSTLLFQTAVMWEARA
jgi:hypothetical protein